MAVLHIYLYYLVLKQSTDVDIIVIPNLQKKKLKFEEMKQVGSNKGSGIGSHVYLMQNLAFLARGHTVLWRLEGGQTIKTQD